MKKTQKDNKANKKALKTSILNSLPKGFKCIVSDNLCDIYLYVNLNKMNFCEANRLVKKLCKDNNFSECGSGVNLTTDVRDWHLENIKVQKEMQKEAKCIATSIEKFISSWSDKSESFICDYKTRDILTAAVENLVKYI